MEGTKRTPMRADELRQRLEGRLERISDYPYCKIPPHFFERKIAHSVTGERRRTMLSVQRWDGRTVVEIEGGNSVGG